MVKRNLFEEIKEGIDVLEEARVDEPTTVTSIKKEKKSQKILDATDELSDKAYNEILLAVTSEIILLFPKGTYSSAEVIKKIEEHRDSRYKSPGEAKIIFDDWKEVMESPKSIFDKKRQTLIDRALKKFSVSDLLLAIRGCVLSPYHMGQHPNNREKKIYNSIELIFRDSLHVEQFKNIALAMKVETDAKIRKSDYDGSKHRRNSSVAEFSPKGEL